MKPLCFVLMPFGRKTDASGILIDFDTVYNKLIAPAIEEAGLEPLRADEEEAGGIIQKPMFERLLLCPFAVADLTTANANVFYELGVRHAVRPWSTVPIFYFEGSRLPFDVGDLRALPYTLTGAGIPADIENDKVALVKRLLVAREAAADKPLTDSPVFQLIDGYPNITSDKTDVFRKQVQYSTIIKKRLEIARKLGVEAIRAIEKELSESDEWQGNNIRNQEAGVIIDLFLSYRAMKAWKEMIALVDNMPLPLTSTVLVQEQLGMALNRDGQSENAEKVLTDLINRRGASSETYGLLGRVYKDRWEAAAKSGDKYAAPKLLEKAANTYLRGFETDWRDAYPGVNAVTLMEILNPPDPRRLQLLPVVAYAVERRIAVGEPDYWDYATLLELAVLVKDEIKARDALGYALFSVREPWEPETTARNLRLIRKAQEDRKDEVPWAKEFEEELKQKGKSLIERKGS